MSPNIDMKERDWNLLIDNIVTGRCILVLGPHMALYEKDGKTKLLREHFSNFLAGEVSDAKGLDNIDDLDEVVEEFLKEFDEAALQYEANKFFDEHYNEDEIYDRLTELPFKLIINTSPDKSLIKAFDRKEWKKGTDFYVDFYNHREGKNDQAEWSDETKPLIFYLYGSSDEWESVVHSEIHLLDFLLSIISHSPALQTNISSRFCDEKSSFLFLGFGFQDWSLRILLYTLLGGKEVQKGKSRRSVALDKIIKEGKSQSDPVTVLFKNKLNIIYPKLSPEKFLAELKTQCDKVGVVLAKDNTKDEPSVADGQPVVLGAPSVFISHASEDKDKAREIFEELRKAKLNPWLDKEELRVGDNWKDVLEETIEGIDYFVVVQSKALENKPRGIVNREINLAIDLNKDIRPGFNYIFPVKIEECELLPGLEGYQALDLSDMKNINQLVRKIKRDWERLNNN